METESKTYADKYGLELTEFKAQREQQKLDAIITEQARANKELRQIKETIKSNLPTLEFVRGELKKAAQDKDSMQREYAKLQQDKDNLQSQIFMQEQDRTKEDCRKKCKHDK